MDVPPHIEDIFERLLSGKASEQALTILRQWLNESPDNLKLWEEYRSTHYLLSAYKQRNKYDPEKARGKIQPLQKQQLPKSIQIQNDFTKWFYRIAAIIIISFAAGMSVMHYLVKPEITERSEYFTEYTVPYGAKSRVLLPDSSIVWLNAGSTLRYDATFNYSRREVFVEGEAYFQVSKDPEKPFYVRTSTIALKVLGTSFNVKAYPDEANVETIVETGLVQVLGNTEEAGKLVLTAGQKAVVAKSTFHTYTKNKQKATTKDKVEDVTAYTTVSDGIDPEVYISWKDNRWRIEKESLASLALKLERRYNVKIIFKDDKLSQYSFSGILEEETLEQVLEVIKLSAPINYQVKHNQVILTRNKWITD